MEAIVFGTVMLALFMLLFWNRDENQDDQDDQDDEKFWYD